MDTSHLLHLKSVVEGKKKKSSLFIMSIIRSVFIYFPHDFCDQNEGFSDTFKIGLVSRFNAFCEIKLVLRAVFSRNGKALLDKLLKNLVILVAGSTNI